jgi:hypothetical protein
MVRFEKKIDKKSAVILKYFKTLVRRKNKGKWLKLL